METAPLMIRTNIKNNVSGEVLFSEKETPESDIQSNVVVDLIAEGGVGLYRYLDNLGLVKERELLLLSSKHYYYYEEDELKNVKTIVNLKKLNQIKYLDIFLNNLVKMLPYGSNLIGCFSDDRIKKGKKSYYNPRRLYDRFINLLDSKFDQIMNINQVHRLLTINGFKNIEMTQMNGLTYFCCQKLHKSS